MRQVICDRCKKVKVHPRNREVVDIVLRYSGILTGGMGGVNAEGIKLVLEIEDIPEPKIFTQKLIIYVLAILEEQKRDVTNG